MRGFPNQGHKRYEGFKPMNAAGEIEYPEPKIKPRFFKTFKGQWIFLDASKDSILWHASFYTEDAAIKVHDYLARGGLLDAKV